MQLQPNTLLQGGKYKIVRVLGQGAPVRITKCSVQFSAKDRTIKDWKFVGVEG